MSGSAKGRRVVVLGGSWFIGRAIVEALLRRGFAVTTVNRGLSPVQYSGPVERVKADRMQPERFSEALRGIEASYLVDVTAYRAVDTLAVLKAFRGRLARAVHISTLSVYRRPFPCPIPEEWPLEADPARGYGFHKAECERLLGAEPASRFPCSILRLPAVYGPGDRISREHFFARRILAGRPILLPEGGRFLCQNIFVEDVAEACCRLLVSPHAVGRAYNVGASPFTLKAYVQLAGELLKRSPLTVRVGMDFLEQGGIDPTGIPYVFEGDLVLKTARLEDELGFRPSVTLEEGLARTFEWLATGPAIEDHHWELPFGAEDRLLRAANGGQRKPPGAAQAG